MARSDALDLVPEGPVLVVSADVHALNTSEALGSLLREFGSTYRLEPLVACGLDLNRLTSVVFAADTSHPPGFIAIFTAANLGDHTFDCLAEVDPKDAETTQVVVEDGLRVATSLESRTKFYAVSPGVLALATPPMQARFEARLGGKGTTTAAGFMRPAFKAIDFDANLALALVVDERLKRDAPRLRFVSAQANVGATTEVKVVARFENSEDALSLASSIEHTTLKKTLVNLGLPRDTADSLRARQDGPSATLTAYAPEEDIRTLATTVWPRLTGQSGSRRDRMDEGDRAFVEQLETDIRARGSEHGQPPDHYGPCLAEFSPELEGPLRRVYCSCVAHEMNESDAGSFEANHTCGVTLAPILLRAAGTEACEAKHPPDVCRCWVEVRAQTREGYAQAALTCLNARD